MILPHEAQPGDLVLAHSKGLFGRLIRLGQSLHADRACRYWNHAAIVVGHDKKGLPLVVQMSKRCVEIPLAQVAPGGKVEIRRCPQGVLRPAAVAYARRQKGTRYGFLTIASIVFNLLTPFWLRVDLSRPGTLICSALVARSWEHGGYDIGKYDPFQVSPAQLAHSVPL